MEKKEEKKLMSFVEYSRHRKCHLKTVQQATEAARIGVVMRNGRAMIDPVQADEQWQRNTDQAYAKMQNGKHTELQPRTPGVPSFHDARAIEKDFNAKIAKLNYEEKVGSLINAEAVEKRIAQLAIMTRDKLMIFPSKVAFELASESNPNKIQIMLEKEVVKALKDLTRGSRTKKD